jgi:hypothetical protein
LLRIIRKYALLLLIRQQRKGTPFMDMHNAGMDSRAGECLAIPIDLIMTAARCWRTARDAGEPVQPSLYAALTPYGYEMLAPIFDSLMTLGEACLCWPLGQDCPFRKEQDGALICELLAEPSRLARTNFGRLPDEGMIHAFNCALISAKIMMRLEQRSIAAVQ